MKFLLSGFCCAILANPSGALQDLWREYECDVCDEDLFVNRNCVCIDIDFNVLDKNFRVKGVEFSLDHREGGVDDTQSADYKGVEKDSELSITFSEDMVVGTLSLGEEFEIRPLDNAHVLLEGNPAKDIPIEVEQAWDHDIKPATDNSSNDNSFNPTSTIEFSIMFYYTNAAMSTFRGSTRSLKIALESAVNHVNAGYRNSQISLKATFLCALPTTGWMSLDSLARFDNYGADVVAAIVGNSEAKEQGGGNYCGVAYLDMWSGHYPFAFTKVSVACLRDVTLGHEIGHTLGLQHDPANAYNYSNNIGAFWGNAYRSIMAYRNVNYRTTQTNYYSSPAITHPRSGLKTGRHNADNRSKILQNMQKLARIGNESGRNKCRSKSPLNFGSSASPPSSGGSASPSNTRKCLPGYGSSCCVPYTRGSVMCYPTRGSKSGGAVTATSANTLHVNSTTLTSLCHLFVALIAF